MRKTNRRRSRASPEVDWEMSDENKTLPQWKALTKEALVLRCQALNSVSTGAVPTLAKRLHSFYGGRGTHVALQDGGPGPSQQGKAQDSQPPPDAPAGVGHVTSQQQALPASTSSNSTIATPGMESVCEIFCQDLLLAPLLMANQSTPAQKVAPVSRPPAPIQPPAILTQQPMIEILILALLSVKSISSLGVQNRPLQPTTDFTFQAQSLSAQNLSSVGSSFDHGTTFADPQLYNLYQLPNPLQLPQPANQSLHLVRNRYTLQFGTYS